jgi:hypothetical protein
MPSAAVTNAAPAPTAGASSGSMTNPFWAASNWYAEPNNDEVLNGSYQLTTSAKSFSISLNSNGYTKDYRCAVRSTGAVGGTPAGDSPENLFQNITFKTPTGSEFYQTATGWDHNRVFNPMGHPWVGDPSLAWDYAQSINPSFTLQFLPELRHTAGALPNMDDRRLYKFDGYVAQNSTITNGTISTSPTVTFASTITTWAQPDNTNLLGQSNQTVPPGIALQTYRRKATVTLNGASSTNTIDARSLTGNIQRVIALVLRDSNGARQDYFSDPIVYKIDNRTLANYTFAELMNQFQDFYGQEIGARPLGVLPFPRFFQPGKMIGQGWLPTNGATKEIWNFSTSSTAANVPGTVDILIEDCIPLTGLPSQLVNI